MSAKDEQAVQYKQKVSLNRLTANGAPSPERKRSFDWLAGMWRHDPGFDRAIAEQHKIDWNLWK